MNGHPVVPAARPDFANGDPLPGSVVVDLRPQQSARQRLM